MATAAGRPFLCRPLISPGAEQAQQLGTSRHAQAVGQLGEAAQTLLYGGGTADQREYPEASVAGRQDGCRTDRQSGKSRLAMAASCAIRTATWSASRRGKDAAAEQKAIREVNTGIMAIPTARLRPTGWAS